jgi:hypothetical protein
MPKRSEVHYVLGGAADTARFVESERKDLDGCP